jgi:hypothetical protein
MKTETQYVAEVKYTAQEDWSRFITSKDYTHVRDIISTHVQWCKLHNVKVFTCIFRETITTTTTREEI